MKKTILILAIILIAFTSTIAQKITADKVPAAVKQAFLKKYPKAADAKWEMEKKEYEVNFKLNGAVMSANFNTKGTWKETETEIKFDALPQSVKDAINKAFADYKTGEVNKIENPGSETLYEVELSKAKEKIELLFTKDGVIKKRKIESEKEKD